MKIKEKIIQKLDNIFKDNKLYNQCKNDYNSRVFLITLIGMVVNVAFIALNTFYSITLGSLWYGVFAAYYFLLTLQKTVALIVYKVIWNKHQDNENKLKREKVKIYLANGAWFIPIAIALAIIVSYMIGTKTPTEKSDIMAIASAAYAFFKISMAIRNIVKAKTAIQDPIVQTIRNIGFVDALTSILVLEATLITTFGEMNKGMYIIIGASGVVIFALTITLGIYMIIGGAKKMKSASPHS